MSSANVPRKEPMVPSASVKFPVGCRVQLNESGRENGHRDAVNRVGHVTGHSRVKRDGYDPYTVIILWDGNAKKYTVSARLIKEVKQ